MDHVGGLFDQMAVVTPVADGLDAPVEPAELQVFIPAGGEFLHAQVGEPFQNLSAVLRLGKILGNAVTVHVAEIGHRVTDGEEGEVDLHLVIGLVQGILHGAHHFLHVVHTRGAVEQAVEEMIPVLFVAGLRHLGLGGKILPVGKDKAVHKGIGDIAVLVQIRHVGQETVQIRHLGVDEGDIVSLHGGVFRGGVLFVLLVGVEAVGDDAAVLYEDGALLHFLGAEGLQLVQPNGFVVATFHTEADETGGVGGAKGEFQRGGGEAVPQLGFIPFAIGNGVPQIAVVGQQDRHELGTGNAPALLIQGVYLEGLQSGNSPQVKEEINGIAAAGKEPVGGVAGLAGGTLAVGEDGAVPGSVLLFHRGGGVVRGSDLLELAQDQVLGLAVICVAFIPVNLFGHLGEAYVAINGILGDILKPCKDLDLLQPVIPCAGSKIQADIPCGDIFR